MLLIGAVLAITAPQAPAAATRAEYSSQVNPICAAGNARAEQILAEAGRRLDRLDRKDVGAAAIGRVFRSINRKLAAAAVATQAEIDLVTPAPGDESIVAAWSAARNQQLVLIKRVDRLDAKISKMFDKPRFDPKIFKRIANFEEKMNKLSGRIEALYETDIELATALGVPYCVTGATGF
jgi:hypothetical protein